MPQIFKLLLWSACCALLLPSCQVNPQLDEPALAHPQNEEVSDDCLEENGNIKRFALQVMPDPSEGPLNITNNITDFVFLGPVHGFRVGKDCLCRLTHYGLVFDMEPSPAELFLYDNQGNELAWSGPYPSLDSGKWVVEVDEQHLNQQIHVAFTPTTFPVPDLLRATGLCMIDNVALPVDTLLRYQVLEAHIQEKGSLDMRRAFFAGSNVGPPSQAPHF